MESIKPAIVAVGYNRPEAMKRLLNSVAHAFYPFDDIDLIVSIDESSRSNDVQQVAEQIPWNHGKKIIKRFDERQGLRKHIIQCGDLSEKYGAVIILEDDLVVAPSFYFYTYLAVNHYATEDRLSGIALYSHSWNGYANLEFRPVHNEFDAYFGQFSITWGQCWTAKQWNGFKTWYLAHENSLPEQNTAMPAAILHWSKQSWGKYFISYMVENDLYYLIPYCALTTNFTEIGQHNTHRDTAHQVCLLQGFKNKYDFPDFEDGIKYDSFFERVFDNEIAGVSASDICVNLNGTKIDLRGKQYLLTTVIKRNCIRVASFGIDMHPIDANVSSNIQGSGIFLYSVGGDGCNLIPGDISLERLLYETYDLTWKQLFRTGIAKFKHALSMKMKKFGGKK
ncbi:MAG: hypothetical protein IKE94_11900 [Aeriscardovia sp.]|nr:hypothetical protein [Aeriscardovia sp.]